MINTNPIYIQSIKSVASEIDVDGGRVLVTGATGLIGSCLVDVLLEANHSFGKHFTVYAMGRSEEKLVRRDRKSTRLNSSHPTTSRMPSSA